MPQVEYCFEGLKMRPVLSRHAQIVLKFLVCLVLEKNIKFLLWIYYLFILCNCCSCGRMRGPSLYRRASCSWDCVSESAPSHSTNTDLSGKTGRKNDFKCRCLLPNIFYHRTGARRHVDVPVGWHLRVHRVATAAFWRTFNHEGKISPGWWGWGVHAHPLSLHLPSPEKLQCTGTL